MDGPFSSATKLFSSSDLNRIANDAKFAPILDEGAPVGSKTRKPSLLTSLLAGAAAGAVVDVTLYPLDTLKTRLQSQQGFKAAGGFHGVYKGIGTIIISSAPTSAVFFSSYNGIVNYMKGNSSAPDSWIHFVSASSSELITASIRVPFELLKQKKQTSVVNAKVTDIMKQTVSLEGFSGLYRGFVSTIAREIPFTALQFPLWEYFKKQISIRHQRPVTAFETALCGAAAGGISAALTTPMDVLKTRIMLASKETTDEYGRLITFYMTRDIINEKGLLGLFAGVVPRVLWITLGGFIYFGVYQSMKEVCEKQRFVPVERSKELPEIDTNLLKIEENEKLMMAQSSPAYTDEDEMDVLDFTQPLNPDEEKKSPEYPLL